MAVTEPWERIVNTTAPKFIKKEEVNILRNRRLLDLLRRKGRISFNWSGRYMDWKVRFKRAPMSGYSDSDVLTFARRSKHKTAQLEWRGYAATDSMTRFEREMNKNDAAIIDIWDGILNSLVDDVTDQFGDKFYVDGNASANLKDIHGIESFLGQSGGVTNSPIGAASDTYAQLDTTLGAYNGTWTTGVGAAWPKGTGDAHYDFWTPLLVDYTNTLATASGGWTSSTAMWAARCLEVMGWAISHSMRNKSMKGRVDLCMLAIEMHRLLKEALRAKEHIVINQGRDNAEGGTGVGFGDTFYIDGCECATEYGIPANTGYGFNTNYIELRSLQKELFKTDGPDFDKRTQAWELDVVFLGNAVFNSPRNFFKLYNYGQSGA